MKKIVALILALAAFSTVVYADVFTNVSSTLGSIVVTAGIDLGKENAYSPVSVNVISNSTRKTVYVDAGIADDKGQYTFEFMNTGNSGSYKVYFSCPAISYSGNKTLTGFKGMNEYQPYLDDINQNMNTPAVLQDKVEAYAAFVGWDLTKYNQITDKTTFYKIFGSSGKQYTDLLELKEDFEFITRLAYDIDKSDSDDFYKLYQEDKEKPTVGFRNVIPGGKTDTVLEDIRTTIRDKVLESTLRGAIASTDSLKQLLNSNILMLSIKYAEHYEDVKIVLEAYKDRYLNGIDLSSPYAVSAYKQMMKNDYAGFTYVEEAYKSIIALELQKEQKAQQPYQQYPGNNNVGGVITTTNALPANNSETSKEISPGNIPKMRFSDMEDAKWALDAVNALCDRKVISGMGDGTFAPHKSVSRAEFAQMAVNMAGYTIRTNSVFSDVPNDAWYANAVKAAKDNGVFSGYIDGTFKPNAEITREQIALVIYKMISDKEDFGEYQKGSFEDDYDIDEAYKEAVYALKSIGVIYGRSDRLFCPNEIVTRVEAAVLLNNISKYYN